MGQTRRRGAADRLWLPLTRDERVRERLGTVTEGERSERVRALFHAAIVAPAARDLDLVRRFRMGPARSASAPARLQIRLNPTMGPRDLALVRYFRGVPARRRGFEAMRLLSALLDFPVDAPSHSWREEAPPAAGIPDLRARRTADGRIRWVARPASPGR